MRLLLLADTHVPARARDLPPAVWAAVDAADVVVHAGDWICEDVYVALASRAAQLIGCAGNNDSPALARLLPAAVTAELDGVRLGVVHQTGPASGREARCDRDHPGLDVLVFGHSHIPWDSRTPSGTRLLNPGSPTDRRRQPFATFMTAQARDGSLQDVVLHRVDPSWR